MKRFITSILLFVLLLAAVTPVTAGRSGQLSRRGGGPLGLQLLWSPDGSKLAVLGSVSDYSDIWLYDSSDFSAEPLVLTPAEPAPTTTIFSQAAFSPDGSILAAGTGGTDVQVWDTATLKELPPLKNALDERVIAVLFSGDGTILAVQGKMTIHLLDAATGTLLAAFQARSNALIALNPDGTRLFVPVCVDESCATGALEIRDITTGEQLDTISTMGTIYQLAFDSETELLGTSAGTVILIDLESGNTTTVLKRSGGILTDYSPENGLLAVAQSTGPFNGSLELFDVRKQSELLTFDEPYQISDVALSPDGTMVAANYSTLVGVWDTSTGKLIAELEPQPAIPE